MTREDLRHYLSVSKFILRYIQRFEYWTIQRSPWPYEVSPVWYACGHTRLDNPRKQARFARLWRANS